MNVSLVAVTQPIVKTEDNSRTLTAEEFIVYCARVSNPSNQLNVETAPRLLAFCLRNHHWSIFEQVHMTLQVETSRAISAQIARHWSFRFQEFSQRYAVAAGFEEVELREKASSNRQGSGEVFDPMLERKVLEPVFDPILSPEKLVNLRASDWVNAMLEEQKLLYGELIDAGVAPECARMVLPLCTRTTLYMCGSVRSWIHYFIQRTSPHAQKEHRLLAEKAQEIFANVFPDTSAAIKLLTAI